MWALSLWHESFPSCGVLAPEHGLSSGDALCKLSWSAAREICFLTRDQTHVPCIARQILNRWTTKEVPQSICF